MFMKKGCKNINNNSYRCSDKATGWTILGSNPAIGNGFPFSKTYRTAPGPIHPTNKVPNILALS